VQSILKNISIKAQEDKLVLQVSNGTLSQECSLLKDFECLEEGEICANFELLYKLIQNLKDKEITLVYDEETKPNLVVKHKRNMYKIPTTDYENFPKLPSFSRGEEVEQIMFETSDFQKMLFNLESVLDKSLTESKPVLDNIFIYPDNENRLKFVATNGVALSSVYLTGNIKKKVSVNGTLVRAIKRLKINAKITPKIKLFSNSHQTALVWKNQAIQVAMFCVKTTEQGPNKEQVDKLGKNMDAKIYLTIPDVGEFLEKIKRVTAISDKSILIFQMNEGELIMSNYEQNAREKINFNMENNSKLENTFRLAMDSKILTNLLKTTNNTIKFRIQNKAGSVSTPVSIEEPTNIDVEKMLTPILVR